MARKYSKELLDKLIAKQEKVIINGAEVLIKNLPDSDEKGGMDLRLYNDMKPQIDMIEKIYKENGKFEEEQKSITEMRALFNGIKSRPMVEKNIEIINEKVKANDGYEIPIRIYKSETLKENAQILYYIHGGGFFAGSPDVVEELVKLIVENTDILAVSVDYRLCPENPYPTGHEDCYSVLKWVYENAEKLGGDKNNIFVSGDSAGGNLAQYCTTKDVESGLGMVRGQLLLYPTLNMANVEDEFFKWSIEDYEISDKYELGIKLMLESFRGLSDTLGAVLGTQDIKNKYLSPYIMNPKGLPPTFITVGEHDFLKPECLAYASKLTKAGIQTETILYKGFGHAYGDNIGVYPQSEDCAIEMGKFILKYSK